MTANQDQTSISGIGGASNSAPLLTPVFSYRVRDGGDIYVYVAQSEITQFAVISYDDTAAEVFYAIVTSNIPARLVARDLVSKAVEEWNEDDDDDEDNPFITLLSDEKAMAALTQVLTRALRQVGEDA